MLQSIQSEKRELCSQDLKVEKKRESRGGSQHVQMVQHETVPPFLGRKTFHVGRRTWHFLST